MFPLQGGNPTAAALYSDDVFSAYTYTGNGTAQTIPNGIALASTAAWSVGKLQESNSQGKSIAIAGSGNTYVAGSANDGSSYGTLSKYNVSGVIQWQRKLRQGASSAQGITVDGSENVYVTGNATDGSNYIFIAKYDASGAIQWQRKLRQSFSVGYGITVDSSGNVYITGYGYESSSTYVSISKYNTSGVIQWQRKLKQLASSGQGIAIDGSGNVYVTGYASDVTFSYIFIAKYDTSGTIQWQRKLQQNASNGYGIATDSSGNVYVTGVANDGVDYISISKYDTSGTIQWQRKLQQGISTGNGIATDTSGNVYVTGYATEGTNYISVSKYNTSGTIQWQRKLQQGSSRGQGIATDTNGNVYVTGYANDGTNDYISIVKLAQDGSTVSGLANGLPMSLGTATDSAGTATDSAGTATDSAGTATDSAGTATDSAGTATYTYGTQAAVTSQGGLVWTKRRNASVTNHGLIDTVRGNRKSLYSNLTGAQDTAPDDTYGITAFNTNGYGLGLNYAFNINESGGDYISWTFRKAKKFFDVVTYTGNGANRTISHSLGIAPGMVVVKRTDAAADWQVYHNSIANTEYMVLNTTAAKATDATRWNSTTATSSVFSLGTDTTVNASGGTYVAYLFAHDTSADGIVQCGSYVGNSGTFGPVVSLGFEPQFLLVKNATSTADWFMFDTARGISTGGVDPFLYANTSAAENPNNDLVQVLATGFQPINSSINTSPQTYIYLAIRRPNKPPTLGTQVYNAIARTGTGADATVTGVGFAPDLVIPTNLSSGSPGVVDRLRGRGAVLERTSTSAEFTSPVGTDIVSFNMDGISVGPQNSFSSNNSGFPYINWFFKRAPGVFDVVCYTGDGAASKVISHSLAATPEFFIIKSRSTTGYWSVGVRGGTSYGDNTYTGLYLHLANGLSTGWGEINKTTLGLTATQIDAGSIGLYSGFGNSNNVTYVAYLFATKAGISKVFSYTGNGSSLTVNCGFTTGARWVMIKRTDSTGDWFVWDSTRGIVAGNDPHLSLNTTAAEVTTDDSVDTDTTGFIVNQVAATNVNVTSATYIGMALS